MRTVAGTFAVVPVAERFARHWMPEPNSGCWLWLGDANKAGYGIMRAEDKRKVLAHRVSYALHCGQPGVLKVLHKCDVPGCVNPAHLFLGTDADNHTDKTLKGRAAVKLTAADVLAIRADTRPGTIVAEAFGISPCTVSEIRRRRTWRHV